MADSRQHNHVSVSAKLFTKRNKTKKKTRRKNEITKADRILHPNRKHFYCWHISKEPLQSSHFYFLDQIKWYDWLLFNFWIEKKKIWLKFEYWVCQIRMVVCRLFVRTITVTCLVSSCVLLLLFDQWLMVREWMWIADAASVHNINEINRNRIVFNCKRL